MSRRMSQIRTVRCPIQDQDLDAPSALEIHIGTARRAVTGQCTNAHAQVQGLVSRWIGFENRVEHRIIESLLPPDERLVPGTLYAAIAFLTGTIATRHRALPLRALLPPLLGTAAFVHYLPRTSANLRAYAGALEDQHFPAFAEAHEVGKAHVGGVYARVRERVQRGRARVGEGVLAAVEKVQAATGLRIQEARPVEEKAEVRHHLI
ncbi:apolipo protein O-domain-containing protein [Mycena olivaceomarginata]|nr:apolipo protein O-domain-containing protein [Mycena olivaceomarginata]